jgi:hypothetical protein
MLMVNKVKNDSPLVESLTCFPVSSLVIFRENEIVNLILNFISGTKIVFKMKSLFL